MFCWCPKTTKIKLDKNFSTLDITCVNFQQCAQVMKENSTKIILTQISLNKTSQSVVCTHVHALYMYTAYVVT